MVGGAVITNVAAVIVGAPAVAACTSKLPGCDVALPAALAIPAVSVRTVMEFEPFEKTAPDPGAGAVNVTETPAIEAPPLTIEVTLNGLDARTRK